MADIDLAGVAARLEAIRRTLGLSKGDFARAFGVAPSVYARVIKAERILLVQHAFTLSKLYNISLDFIYAGNKKGLSPDMRAAIERHLGENAAA